jgi:hypothetical protein
MPLRLLPRTHTLRWRPQLPHGQSPHPGTRLCGSIGVVQPVTTGHDRPHPRMESHAAAIVHRILEAPMPQPRRVTKTTNIVPGLRVEERGQNSPESNAQGNVARRQTSVPTPDGVPPAQSLTPSLSLSPHVLFWAELQTRAKTPLSSPPLFYTKGVRDEKYRLRGCWDLRDFLGRRKAHTFHAAAAFSRGCYGGEEGVDKWAPPTASKISRGWLTRLVHSTE